MRRVQNRDERGASLVEFALVAPVFFLLLLGTITGGLAFSHKLDLSTAAREAARYAATLPDNEFQPDPPSTTPAGTAWASAIAGEATNATSGALGASGSTVCVALVKGPSSSTTVGASSDGSYYYYDETYNGTSWVPIAGPTPPLPCFSDAGSDSNARVQVMLTRPDSIEATFFNYHVTLQSEADAYFEPGF
jgi:Flp pilus assembly protein TadG